MKRHRKRRCGLSVRVRRTRGQSSIEYILMVGFGALLSLYLVDYFTGIFREGLAQLERNVSTEVASGLKFNSR